MLTDKETAEIRTREEAATEGPWEWEAADGSMVSLGKKDHVVSGGGVLWCTRCESCQKRKKSLCGWPNEANSDFIANARTDIPKLLADLEELLATIAGLRKEGERDGLLAEIKRLKEPRNKLPS